MLRESEANRSLLASRRFELIGVAAGFVLNRRIAWLIALFRLMKWLSSWRELRVASVEVPGVAKG